MTAVEARGREQILRAAARLTAEGLVARTWGNISLRVSDDQFLITPSGLAYETLREDQLVLVNAADCSWTGAVRPSSEKGIHADVYRLRPEVNAVIHTHQYWASIAGIEGRALTGFSHPLLGKRVPCAAYGLPGSRGLRRAVEREEKAWPDCRAFLLRSHGAVCLGRDMEDAFAAARALEEVCGARVRDQLGEIGPLPQPPELGTSSRRGDAFVLVRGGVSRIYPVHSASLPPAAALHGAVYRAGAYQYVAQEAAWEVLAASGEGRRLRPYLDDLAQMAGADIRCARPDPRRVTAAVRGRNAVLLAGAGALCAGGTEGDVEALRALLRKGCAAWLYAREEPGSRALGRADALAQRLVYQTSYRRKGSAC